MTRIGSDRIPGTHWTFQSPGRYLTLRCLFTQRLFGERYLVPYLGLLLSALQAQDSTGAMGRQTLGPSRNMGMSKVGNPRQSYMSGVWPY